MSKWSHDKLLTVCGAAVIIAWLVCVTVNSVLVRQAAAEHCRCQCERCEQGPTDE